MPATADAEADALNVREAAPAATVPVASPSELPELSLSVTLMMSPLHAALMLATFNVLTPYRLLVASQLGAPKLAVTPSVSQDATTVALSPTAPVATPPRPSANANVPPKTTSPATTAMRMRFIALVPFRAAVRWGNEHSVFRQTGCRRSSLVRGKARARCI